MATPKHFAVHSGPEPDRHHFDARVSERDLRETYLPAFEACVKEGGAVSIMGAYNRTNGEPCCGSPTLLGKILRQEWGFGGYVVSDCWAINDIFGGHGVVKTAEEAAALAVKNGCDLECGCAYPALRDAVEQGLIDEATIDRSLVRLFTARMRLGQFDPPQTQSPYAAIPFEVNDSPAHRALARQAAQKTIVLLKNEGLLPLPKDLASIAVIGPNADDLDVLLGNYHGTPSRPSRPWKASAARSRPPPSSMPRAAARSRRAWRRWSRSRPPASDLLRSQESGSRRQATGTRDRPAVLQASISPAPFNLLPSTFNRPSNASIRS